MNRVKIVRTDSNPDSGTFGILSVNGVPLCNTLELFWRNNASNVSCIPSGVYHCIKHESRIHDWRVLDVTGRSGILFHCGNTIADIEGCILFGTYIGSTGGVLGVRDSQIARAKFNLLMDSETQFCLEVIDSF